MGPIFRNIKESESPMMEWLFSILLVILVADGVWLLGYPMPCPLYFMILGAWSLLGFLLGLRIMKQLGITSRLDTRLLDRARRTDGWAIIFGSPFSPFEISLLILPAIPAALSLYKKKVGEGWPRWEAISYVSRMYFLAWIPLSVLLAPLPFITVPYDLFTRITLLLALAYLLRRHFPRPAQS